MRKKWNLFHFWTLLQNDLTRWKSNHVNYWADRTWQIPWHMCQVETYQAVILITQLTSSGKFCKIDEWSNIPWREILDWGSMSGLCENSSKEKIANRKPPFPWTSKCVRLTVIAEGYKSWHCPPKVKFFLQDTLKIGDCLTFAHDVTLCMCSTDLVKCCLQLISPNHLASSARMRSCAS